MLLPSVDPAPRTLRVLSACVDLALLALSLVLVYNLLPVVPPPADAMAFYTEQDFRNYLSLIAMTFVNATAGFACMAVPGLQATPGQFAVGLRVVTFEGKPPSIGQIAARWIRAIGFIALLAIPGPLVAVLIGVVVAGSLGTAFTTTDRLLLSSGIPDTLRLVLHGLSFFALGLALVYMAKRLVNFTIVRQGSTLTSSDKRSLTTVVRRDA